MSSSGSSLPPSPGTKKEHCLTDKTRRLQGELMTLMTSPTPGVSAFPHNGDLTVWDGTIVGPADTPYSGLTLKLRFNFPARYPYVPPEVRFTTPIYHPNVDMKGRICLDILKDKWSAVLNVGSVLLSLQSLLGEPNKYVYSTIIITTLTNSSPVPRPSMVKQLSSGTPTWKSSSATSLPATRILLMKRWSNLPMTFSYSRFPFLFQRSITLAFCFLGLRSTLGLFYLLSLYITQLWVFMGLQSAIDMSSYTH